MTEKWMRPKIYTKYYTLPLLSGSNKIMTGSTKILAFWQKGDIQENIHRRENLYLSLTGLTETTEEEKERRERRTKTA